MLSLLKKAFITLVSLSLLVGYLPIEKGHAQVSSCSVIVSPSSVTAGSTSGFLLQVSNTSSSIIVWVKITRPSANFTLTQASASGWTVSQTSSTTIFTGGNIPPGLTRPFQERNVAIANVNAPSANWTVEVSDDPSGANPTACTGSLGTEIVGATDTTAPVISNLSASSVTSNSAVIQWTTDEAANSKVDFGFSASYGQSVSNGSFVTSHSLNITSLTAGTTYHFKVTSADSSNNSAESGDSTFKTASSGSNPPPPPSSSISIKKLDVQSTEKVPPTIAFTSKTAGIYKTGPTITGRAEDNTGVLLIEYSVDGGKNWLPVNQTSGLKTPKATFQFKTENLPEGDFQILARVFDTSGNETKTAPFSLVIDSLKPFIGGNLVSFGPQILSANLQTMVGLSQKITMPVIGGANQVKLVAKKEGSEELSFDLVSLTQTNLWSGEIKFAEAGSYDLEVISKDGANNEVKRQLSKAEVSSAGLVVDEKGSAVSDAKVELLYFEPESETWVIWDGRGFGVTNPQQSSKEGAFSFFVPKGKYYLRAQAKDFLTFTSEIFEIDTSGPISTKLTLSKPMLKIGPLVLDWRLFSASKIEVKGFETQSLESKEAETLLPNFSLDSTLGQKVNSLSLRGKPTLVTILGSWSPPSNEEIPILEQLAQNKDLNIVPIMSMESLGKIEVIKEITGTKLDFLVDPQGEISQKLGFQSLPTSYVVTRNGVIKKVLVGVLSKEELLESLEVQ